MCVSTINGETNNHMIQEKEPTKNEDIFGMDDSAVILERVLSIVLSAFFISKVKCGLRTAEISADCDSASVQHSNRGQRTCT